MSAFALRIEGKGVQSGGGFITPGSVVFGVGTWAADTYSTPEGSSGDLGYDDTPSGCNWTVPTWQECTADNDVTLSCVGAGTPTIDSIVAGDVFCNMKQFELAIGGGDYLAITSASTNPLTGILDWNAQAREADFAASGVYEVRARAIPKVGQPFLMQGADPTSTTMSYSDTWSTYIVVDKGDLPRISIYKAPNNDPNAADDATNTGLTDTSPVYKWSTAFALVRAHADFPNVIATFYMTASQDHEWGEDAEELILESGYGWTTFQPAPGLTAADVKINRALAANIPCRKLKLKNITMGDVAISNTAVSGTNTAHAPSNLHNCFEGIETDRAHDLDPDGTLSTDVTATSSSQRITTGNMTTAASQPAGMTLPTLMSQITVENTGAVDAYVLGSSSSSVTVTTGTGTLVAAGATVGFARSNFYAFITASGSTDLTFTGVNANYGQPLNPAFITHAATSQRVEWINSNLAWAFSVGLFQSTLMIDVTIDHIGNNGDMADNCKCILGLTITNTVEGVAFNHLDAIQPTSFTDLKHRWFQDITALADDGWYGQFILGDAGNIYDTSVFLRLKTRPLSSAWGFAGSYKGNRVIYPDQPAGGVISPKGYINPTQTWLNAPFASNYIIYDSTGAGVGNLELIYRQEVRHIYPFTTTMPQANGATLPESSLKTILGDDALEIFDLDIPEYVGRIHHDDLDPPTFYADDEVKIRFVQNAVFPEQQTSLDGVATAGSLSTHPHMNDARTSAGDTSATQIDAKRPICLEDAVDTHRAAHFNPGTQDVTQGSGKVPGICLGGVMSNRSSFKGYISGTTLTVAKTSLGSGLTADIGGYLAPGDFLLGTGVTTGTTIVSQLTGTDGQDGTYEVSDSQTVGSSGSTVAMTTTAFSASTPCEIWFAIDNNHIAQQVAGGGASTDTTQRMIRHIGSSATNSVSLARQTISGVECFVAHAGQTDGTTKAGISVTTSASGVSAAGPGVVRIELLDDGIQITFWNAASGTDGITPIKKTFASNDASKLTLSHVLGTQVSSTLGSSSVVATGVTGTFCGFDLYANTVSLALSDTKRDLVLADMKDRVGIS